MSFGSCYEQLAVAGYQVSYNFPFHLQIARYEFDDDHFGVDSIQEPLNPEVMPLVVADRTQRDRVRIGRLSSREVFPQGFVVRLGAALPAHRAELRSDP
jgi:hypothetical protein